VNFLYNKSRLRYFICSFIYAVNLLVILSIVSCGRRGDPFLTSPHDVSEEETSINIKERKQGDNLSKERKDIDIDRPGVPSGLVGVFTGESVVLSWDEIEGQGVAYYMVYRDDGNGFIEAGITTVPAFIDERIKMKSRYRYRISAIGTSESEFSTVIEIVTEER
jgi:hypothetical protein